MVSTGVSSRRVSASAEQATKYGWYAKAWKRPVDVVISALLVVALIIPMLLVALAIRIDSPGNPLFLQKRVGKDGRVFTMWKFRTMQDSPSDQLLYLVDDDGQLRHKVKNDPRVTRLGRILRKTSVDEIPQVVNVVLGHMSMVGPRPELPQIVDGYELWQHRRHDVRPGITGWWQVSGRSDLPMHEHTELDIHYVENLSPQLDLRIVGRTIVGVARGLGAF